MTFLPIIERELRVAARRAGTFWLRVIAALVALLLGAGFLLLELLLQGVGVSPPLMHKALFSTLTWLGLAAALGAGLFFTSDAISREKREGTLGFLFLTDLRGYDVLLGKLLAAWWRSSFALLAVVPVLALTLLLGGVSGGEFWRTILALFNALFCSLSVGLLMSALCRQSQWAMLLTLAATAVLAGGGPVGDGLLALVSRQGFRAALSLSSPVFVFLAAGSVRAGEFWLGLVLNQLLAWAMLGAASVLAGRVWREGGRLEPAQFSRFRLWCRQGGPGRRAALRRKLLERDPAQWLGCRERWQSMLMWALALAATVGFGAALWLDAPELQWVLWGWWMSALGFVVQLLVASQAGRGLIEARQNGVLELLLTSPLGGWELAQGQWRALVRLFGWPVGLFLLMQLLGSCLMHQVSTMGIQADDRRFAWAAVALGIGGTLGTVVNLAAVAWFGLWMGLTSSNVTMATLKTWLYVQLIPWFVIGFVTAAASALLLAAGLIVSLGSGVTSPSMTVLVWWMLAAGGLSVLLSVLKDVGFIVYARRKLSREFREAAGRALGPLPGVAVTNRRPPKQQTGPVARSEP